LFASQIAEAEASPRAGGTSGPVAARARLSRVDLFGRLIPLALLAIVAVYFVFEARHLHGFTYARWGGKSWSDYDEGVYIQSAWQLNAGHHIFSQVFSSQPLLFLEGLALTLRIQGPDAGYQYPLICGLLALLGVVWLSWEVSGRWSALLACAVLAVSPGFVIASHAIEAEAPMLAFGTLAVAASARYARTGRRAWLVFASLLVAAATLSKLLAVALLLPVLVALVLKWWEIDKHQVNRRILGDVVASLACGLVPVLLAFTLVAPGDQWSQVISFHLKASRVATTAGGNGSIFGQFLGWDPGLVALAAGGIALAAFLRLRLALIPVSWLAADLATMVNYQPLFVHHLTVLLAPMAALAGLTLSFVPIRGLGIARKSVITVVITCTALAYLIWLPDVLSHTRHVFIADSASTDIAPKLKAAAWLDAHTAPQDTIVVDDQVIAVLAHRKVPSELTDTSTIRCVSGYLSASTLLDATRLYQVRTVLLTRALQARPECGSYVPWLIENYDVVKLPPGLGAASAYVLPRP
jgi:hypothetical protein